MTRYKATISWDTSDILNVPESFFSAPEHLPQFQTVLEGADHYAATWGWVVCDSPRYTAEEISNLWEQHGRNLPAQLAGAFSVVIWDHGKQELFAARDKFGQAPLCFCLQPTGIIFSSHLADLAHFKEFRGEPDRVMIAEYLLSLGDAPALPEQTFFSNIKRLPPAHTMSLKPGTQPRFQRYWDLAIPDQELDIPEAEATSTCRQLIITATENVLGNDKVGVFASGGLDSSVLAATAHLASGTYPDLLFLKAPVEENDESNWLNDLAGSGPYPVHTQTPTGAFAEMDTMLDILAEPWGYENLHHDFLLFQEAARQHCSQVISGYYGDVVVDATLDYLIERAQNHEWEELEEELKQAESIQGIPAESYIWRYAGGVFEEMARSGQWKRFRHEAKDVATRFKLPMKPLIWHWWLRPVTPKPLRKLFRVVTGSQCPVWWELNRHINPQFADAVDADMRAREMKASWTSPPTSAKETHRNIITHTSTALALEQMAALGASQHAQPIFPFINEELIDFALALPRNFHGRDGWDRWILRKAMESDLPESVCWRQGRTHYAATAHFEMKAEAKRINAFIAEWPDALSEYVDQTMFLSDWEWYLEEDEVSPELAAAGRRVFRTFLLGKWLERYG